MTVYLIRRILAAVPSVIGITLAAFILLNLSMTFQTAEGLGGDVFAKNSSAFDDRSRYPDYHLPLFINLSIADAGVYARKEIDNLKDPSLETSAKRSLTRAGGAWLPYIIPSIDNASSEQKESLIEVLDTIGARLGVSEILNKADDKAAFWINYWNVYKADFKSVRAGRLINRLIKGKDDLVLREIYSLDTFCLPQLFEVLDNDISRESLERVVEVIVNLTGIDDPVDRYASQEATQAVIDRWKNWWSKRYDRYTSFEGASSLIGAITETRYFRWLSRLVTLDFGVSIRDGLPVTEKLAARLPVTLLLTTLSLMLAYLVAVPIGIISAVRRGALFDRVTMMTIFIFYSLPTFWLAMWLIRLFAGGYGLSIFPAQGLFSFSTEGWSEERRLLDMAHHLVLPVICLASVSAAILARYQREGMIRVIDLDFMRAAQAKGLSRTQAILKHGLRNGIIPVVTMLGLQIPYLVSSSVVVERIFGIPGMGYETFEAILAQDQPWLVAVVTVTAVMTMIGAIVADTIYAALDPRIAPGLGGSVR